MGCRCAFIYNNGTMTDLNSLLPPDSGWILISANAINNNGQIVGVGLHNGATHAFLVEVPVPLRVDVVPSASATMPGAVIGFHIDVTAPSQAQSFEIQTPIPQGTTLNPGSVTNGGTVTIDASESHITWDLPAGTSTQVSFSVTVNPLDELPTSLERIEGQATASAVVDGETLNGSSQYSVPLVRDLLVQVVPSPAQRRPEP